MATSTIKRNGLGAPTTIDLNSGWTAPTDGIVNVMVGWMNNESYGYCYIQDTTTSVYVCAISDAGALGGFMVNSMFPAIKGHTYRVTLQDKAGSIASTFHAI